MIKKNQKPGEYMVQNHLRVGICPQCGETLEVPAHLEEFSCLYCGSRLTPQQLHTEEDPQVLTLDLLQAQGCAAYYEAHIMETITKHIGIEKEVTRSGYEAAFDRYSKSNAEIFRQLDEAVSAGVISVEEAVSSFLDQLEARWDFEVSKHKRRSVVLDTDKFVIAIFLVPMIRRMELSVSEEYCKVLQANWCARHPKFPFYLGTYEELTGGFQKKFLGLCFITTAVCQEAGKPDDCPELTAFRAFRDGYLRSCPDGPALIAEYYDIAPGIVLRMELAHDRAEQYARLRREYLEPCYEDLLAGRLAQCKDRYVTMVRHLEQQYLQ